MVLIRIGVGWILLLRPLIVFLMLGDDFMSCRDLDRQMAHGTLGRIMSRNHEMPHRAVRPIADGLAPINRCHNRTRQPRVLVAHEATERGLLVLVEPYDLCNCLLRDAAKAGEIRVPVSRVGQPNRAVAKCSCSKGSHSQVLLDRVKAVGNAVRLGARPQANHEDDAARAHERNEDVALGQRGVGEVHQKEERD